MSRFHCSPTWKDDKLKEEQCNTGCFAQFKCCVIAHEDPRTAAQAAPKLCTWMYQACIVAKKQNNKSIKSKCISSINVSKSRVVAVSPLKVFLERSRGRRGGWLNRLCNAADGDNSWCDSSSICKGSYFVIRPMENGETLTRGINEQDFRVDMWAAAPGCLFWFQYSSCI